MYACRSTENWKKLKKLENTISHSDWLESISRNRTFKKPNFFVIVQNPFKFRTQIHKLVSFRMNTRGLGLFNFDFKLRACQNDNATYIRRLLALIVHFEDASFVFVPVVYQWAPPVSTLEKLFLKIFQIVLIILITG